MKELIVTTSWDDGTIDDLRLAALLDKYGIKGTLYIPKFMEKRLPDKEIIALDKNFEIGAHSLTQPDLTKVPLAEARKEVRESKKYLEELLGHDVPMFCYPYGTYNRAVMEIVETSGFTAARTADAGGLGLPANPYKWHITLAASDSSPLMALKIWWHFHLWSPGALLDWETRAKALFDLALNAGGVYHMYGHSWEIERKNEWDKLERVLAYISGKESAIYITNDEVFQRTRE